MLYDINSSRQEDARVNTNSRRERSKKLNTTGAIGAANTNRALLESTEGSYEDGVGEEDIVAGLGLAFVYLWYHHHRFGARFYSIAAFWRDVSTADLNNVVPVAQECVKYVLGRTFDHSISGAEVLRLVIEAARRIKADREARADNVVYLTAA